MNLFFLLRTMMPLIISKAMSTIHVKSQLGINCNFLCSETSGSMVSWAWTVRWSLPISSSALGLPVRLERISITSFPELRGGVHGIAAKMTAQLPLLGGRWEVCSRNLELTWTRTTTRC